MKRLLFIAALACAPLLAATDDDEKYSSWGYSNGHAYVGLFGTRAERTPEDSAKVFLYIAGVFDGMSWAEPKAQRVPLKMDVEQMVEYLDLFYANPLNRVIGIGAVFAFARNREDHVIPDHLVEGAITYLRKEWMKEPPPKREPKPRTRLTL